MLEDFGRFRGVGVSDFDESALNFVERGERGGFAAAGEGLAQEAALFDQILGAGALAGKVAAVRDFGENDAGAVEMVSEGDFEDALASLGGETGENCGLWLRRARDATGEECACQQNNGRGYADPRVWSTQSINDHRHFPDTLTMRPDAALEGSVGLGNMQLIAETQGLSERVGCSPAFGAIGQVSARVGINAGLVVVNQDKIFFGQVFHFVLTAGSRARRNFWTARKTLCLAAPGWTPSAAEMSSMLRPS